MQPSTMVPDPARMTIPSSPARKSLESQITALRTRLKDWEKQFSLSHEGRKASRDDIKADGPDGIGKVYKKYSSLRDELEGKVPPADTTVKETKRRTAGSQTNASSPKKRKGEAVEDDALSRHKLAIRSTPRKPRQSTDLTHPSTLDPYDPPLSVTPRPLKAYIGPTPQRDGKVLGLFDLLSGSSKATPSTATRKRKADALSEGTGNVMQTPSRRRGEPSRNMAGADEETAQHTGKRQRFQRTPASEGKKFLLSQFFASPGAARYIGGEEESEGRDRSDKTPLRTRLLAGRGPVQMEDILETEEPGPDSTPPFLRRTSSLNQRLLSVERGTTSPVKTRNGPNRLSLFKKGKSLSEIVQSLRKAQDEQHDDDLEALNEIEDDMMSHDDDVQQPVTGNSTHINEPAEGQGDTGQPQWVWKKKGQKRTTRRVVMKPPTAAKKSKITQPPPPPAGTEQQQLSDSEDELAADHDYDPKDPGDGREAGKRSDSGTGGSGKKREEPNKKGRTVKANAVSQMNFRSLKIKNKNSKAKGRGGGFGRFNRSRR